MNIKMMNLIKEETDEEFAKKHFPDDPEEQRLWLKVKELGNKYMGLGRFNKDTPYWAKNQYKKAQSDLEKHRRNKERKAGGMDVVKKVMKQVGLPHTVAKATRIRGFNYYSKGWNITSGNSIEFYNISQQEFDNICKELESQGFTITDKKNPDKMMGGGNHSSITLKK